MEDNAVSLECLKFLLINMLSQKSAFCCPLESQTTQDSFGSYQQLHLAINTLKNGRTRRRFQGLVSKAFSIAGRAQLSGLGFTVQKDWRKNKYINIPLICHSELQNIPFHEQNRHIHQKFIR